MAFSFTIAFIYARFSFIHEFLAGYFWIDFHILLIIGSLAMLTCLASGQLLSGLSSPAVRVWVAFFGFMCVASVFSTWRGNSVDVLSAYARTNMPLLLLIPGVAVTGAEIKKIINTIAYAGATTIVLGRFSDSFTSGRLEIETAAGTIQNPNDFAALLILILPAIAYWTFQKDRNLFLRIAGIGLMGLGAVELVGTGSRGALVALMAMGAYLLVRGSTKLRLALIVGVPLLIGAILPFAPSSALDRMTSLVASKETVEAAESREARIALFNASIDITFHHPLFGIGPGEFMDYQGGMAAAKGQHGMWHQTHNGYTQISSECGLPAALCFLAGIFMTMRSLRRSTKANIPFISGIARTFSVMMVGYAVCLIFLSQAYSFVPPVLCAIALAIERYVESVRSVNAPAAAP
jgi:O-antigen ligase